MCIFSELASVNDTKIFVGISTLQSNLYAVVYECSAQAQTDTPTSMLLAVFNPHSIPLDETNFFLPKQNFFQLVMQHVNNTQSEYLSETDSLLQCKSSGFGSAPRQFSVGSWQVHVFDTLALLEENTPEISESTRRVLHSAYGNNQPFSFVRAKLDGKSMKLYHPLGYMLPFKQPEDILIPTKHAHGDEQDEVLADWDHEITVMSDSPAICDAVAKTMKNANISVAPIATWNSTSYICPKLIRQLNTRAKDWLPPFNDDLVSSGAFYQLSGRLPNVDLNLVGTKELKWDCSRSQTKATFSHASMPGSSGWSIMRERD